MTTTPRPTLAVLISGQGRNLQAIIEARGAGRLNADIRVVICNRSTAPGLDFARAAGIPVEIVLPSKNSTRAQYDERLADTINNYTPDIVVLAGFMRILDSAFVNQFSGRLVNIHPSLLPRYRGLDTHRRVLAAGDARHGASVHFVTEDLDAGPTLLQGSIAVQENDTPEALAQRLMQRVETRIYPQALEWIASGRARLQSGHIVFDERRLETPKHEDCDALFTE